MEIVAGSIQTIGDMLRSVNPFDQSLLGEIAEHDSHAINTRLESAAKTFNMWKGESFAKRADMMKRAGDLLRSGKDEYARIISTEMGKVLREAEGEVEKCAAACHFFAEKAEDFLRDQMIQTDASKSFVAWQPLGPVLAPVAVTLRKLFTVTSPSLAPETSSSQVATGRLNALKAEAPDTSAWSSSALPPAFLRRRS